MGEMYAIKFACFSTFFSSHLEVVLQTLHRAYMGCVEENIGRFTPDREPRSVKWRLHKWEDTWVIDKSSNE
jgi:hypothetical protein